MKSQDHPAASTQIHFLNVATSHGRSLLLLGIFNVTSILFFGVMNSWQTSTIYIIFSPSVHRCNNHLITFFEVNHLLSVNPLASPDLRTSPRGLAFRVFFVFFNVQHSTFKASSRCRSRFSSPLPLFLAAPTFLRCLRLHTVDWAVTCSCSPFWSPA